MPVRAVVGLQFGDDGKGRTADMLAQQSDLVIRFQGGPNAGHRVVNKHGRCDLHQVPAGIFYDGVDCLAGPGMVIDPQKLKSELQTLERSGVSCDRFTVAERAHAILPHHRLTDLLAEKQRGDRAIGTTLSGVGPCYAEKTSRDGYQLGALLHMLVVEGSETVTELLGSRVRATCARFGEAPEGHLEGIGEWVDALASLADRIGDSRQLVLGALARDARILVEGQLGAMKDLDSGIYPYVTSSNPTPGGIFTGAGIPVNTPVGVLGVAKAYTTAVGAGPMPTELDGPVADHMREVGGEYGVTTGRPRRCGWFDAVAVRQAIVDGGVGELVLTKLDVLSGLQTIKICVGYELGNEKLDSVPLTHLYWHVKPIYETHSGWEAGLEDVREFAQLPTEAQAYVVRIEELVKVPISIISVGPARDQAIIRP